MSNKISTKGAAHDLRHLLTIIRLTAEQLEALGCQDTAYKAARIQRTVDRAADICTNLLNNQDVAALTNVSDVIDEVIAETKPPEGVLIVSDCPPDLYVHKPQSPLFRLLFNLVLNAMSAIRSGGGSKILIGARELDTHTVILVQDDGPGFGPLESLSSVSKADGLGLRIAQSCAAELDGRLELVEQEGMGAMLALWLPRMEYWAADMDAAGAEVLTA